ncbi:TetR/AcrR family transcriptional regulator, partial [Streptomyces sp. NPDC127110]|uniref:TetR/AcrR family transcriptional regulator n=1 Tax=Streptomyces sp. NPDC127110 TaxID=3345362 RepID=UPI00363A7EDC
MVAGGVPVRAARKNAPPREDVLAAAMATIAERGLEGLTMAGLGRQVGMSSGHLLYYFGSKDELLLQTLEWSEAALGGEGGGPRGPPPPPRRRRAGGGGDVCGRRAPRPPPAPRG